jgi:hypothetical protein
MPQYPAKLTKDGSNILVTFRDVPEAITFGANEKKRSKIRLTPLLLGYPFMSMRAKNNFSTTA